MTTKFKAGDKVVATERFHSIKAGDVCTFDHCLGKDMFCVKEHPELRLWDKKWLLQEPQFKNMKFRVSSPEHSKEIQEALFEMGYKWWGQSTVLNFVDNPFLYSEDTGIIAIGQSQDFFERLNTHQEYLVETTKSYKLVPVEIPKPEVITIDGKTYDKEAVLRRLAELEEVK